MNTSACTLSQKRYAIARIAKYLQLLVVILLLFAPILQITSTESTFGGTTITEKAGISVIQFLSNNGESDVTLSYNGSTNDSAILNELFSNRINVLYEGFGGLPEGMLSFIQVGSILFGLLVGALSLLSSRANATTMRQNSLNSMQLELSNRMYITKVYDSLPKVLEFVEKAISFMIILPCFFVIVTKFAAQILQQQSSWSINIVTPIVVIVLLILFMNGVITHIIAAKDINEIKTNGLRFEEAYEFPTIASDIHAMGRLFGVSSEKKQVSQPSQGSVDEAGTIELLQKYKNLLDAGIINEKEYQEKKEELLKRKD